ncbi:unnamed protein product, partial [Closterium sp. NIES-53]
VTSQQSRSILGQFALQDLMICNAARVERFYFDSQALLPEVVRQELLIGAEQVGDTHLPSVSVHLQLKKLLFTFLFPHLESLERQSQLNQSAAAHSSHVDQSAAAHSSHVDQSASSNSSSSSHDPPSVTPWASPLAHTPADAPAGALTEGPVGTITVTPPLVPPVSTVTLLLLAHPGSDTEGDAEGQNAAEGGGGDDDEGENPAASAVDAREGTGGGGRGGRSTSIREAVARHEHLLPPNLRASYDVVLAVGPEGGWLPYELHLFARLGFHQVAMGHKPLRTD